MRVLVAEDNQDLAGNLIDFLELKSCTVDWAANGRQALNLVEKQPYDLIVLDIMMPGPDGLKVCRQLRQSNIDTPVLFLTARDTLDDKLEGFATGGDDYLVKPFSMEELFARLQALYKRNLKQKSTLLQVEDLILNLETFKVSRAGQKIHLNPSCMKLLRCLMQHAPDVVTRETLCYTLWGDDVPDKDVLRSHLYHLRTAIDKGFDRPLLHTIHGVGFRLHNNNDS